VTIPIVYSINDLSGGNSFQIIGAYLLACLGICMHGIYDFSNNLLLVVALWNRVWRVPPEMPRKKAFKMKLRLCIIYNKDIDRKEMLKGYEL
jgi:hypothetical protein